MHIRGLTKWIASGVCLVACNGILGVGSDYHLVSKDAGSVLCTSKNDCSNGEICLFGTCNHTCRKDGDCPAGWRCLNTDEGAACVTPAQAACADGPCPRGTTCVEGQCRSDCVDPSGCSDDQTCSTDEVCVGTSPQHDVPFTPDAATSDGGAPGGGRGGLDASLPGAGGAGGAEAGGVSNGGATSAGGIASTGGLAAGGASAGGTDGGSVGGPAIGHVGAPCPQNAATACEGHAQQQQLICVNHVWGGNGKCTGSFNCDSTPGADAGSCRAIIAGCVQAGDVICQGMSRITCGIDLVTTTQLDTCTPGTETCTNGACTECGIGTANCDGNATDCETDLNSTATCGTTCQDATACSMTQGTASCTAGACGMSSCVAGFGDCTTGNDGCERDVMADEGNCGGCGNSCSAQQLLCVAGFCSCVSHASCGSQGFCSVKAGDVGGRCSCGGLDCAFGERCNALHVCTCNGAGACFPGQTCCNSPAGCKDLSTDPANCGFCGHACQAGFICNAGVCVCDVNCACIGVTCPGGQTCVNGSCG